MLKVVAAWGVGPDIVMVTEEGKIFEFNRAKGRWYSTIPLPEEEGGTAIGEESE